jgi:hypothetical protein
MLDPNADYEKFRNSMDNNFDKADKNGDQFLSPKEWNKSVKNESSKRPEDFWNPEYVHSDKGMDIKGWEMGYRQD